jgi:hypothetical protein
VTLDLEVGLGVGFELFYVVGGKHWVGAKLGLGLAGFCLVQFYCKLDVF